MTGQAQPQLDMLFLVPWLKRGGADLACLLTVEAALAINPRLRMAVWATEAAASPWADRLPPSVTFVRQGDELAALPCEARAERLCDLVVASEASVVHVVQSPAGWQMLAAYGHELSRRASLFASVYLDAFAPDGQVFSYARQYLPACHDALTTIFSDTVGYGRRLAADLGIPPEKFRPLHHPVAAGKGSSTGWTRPSDSSRRILWASRLDRQKRPDLLFEIARLLPELQFHAYGETVLDHDYGRDLLQRVPANVVLAGPYDRFHELPLNLYQCLVYTSEADGLPNVLLEAGHAGLPIVAPALGGIPELLDAGTAYLVDADADAAAFAAALRDCLDDPAAPARGLACRHRIAGRHGSEQFLAALRSVPSYLPA